MREKVNEKTFNIYLSVSMCFKMWVKLMFSGVVYFEPYDIYKLSKLNERI